MTAFSNVLTSTPLTAANLQRVVAEMMSASERPLAVQPDTLIMPPALYGEWLHLCLLDAERELKHALKIADRAILSGHYEKRQRQRAGDVAAYRLRRRRDMAAQLPRLQSVRDEAEATLSAWQAEQNRPRQSVDWAKTGGAFFETTAKEATT